MKKEIQFELWKECNSRCKFCFQGTQNICTATELKISACEKALEKISDLSLYETHDVISYIGGEFFQGQLNTPEVKEAFMKLMEKSAWLLENGYVRGVWIYATMNLGEQKDLYETIDLFKKKDGLWILTSYDTIGRFHTPKMLETWENHMKTISEKYPEIKLNTTMIITQDLINKYLNNEINFEEFMEKYHTQLFLKPCCKIDTVRTKEEVNKFLPNFFPRRMDFIKFLIKFKQNESQFMYDKLFNINMRADELYRNYNDGTQMQLTVRHKDNYTETVVDRNDIKDCGHGGGYQGYIDSDGCVVCDKIMVDNMA